MTPDGVAPQVTSGTSSARISSQPATSPPSAVAVPRASRTTSAPRATWKAASGVGSGQYELVSCCRLASATRTVA